MMIEPVGQIDFDDLDAKCPGFVLIKQVRDVVGISISLETDGAADALEPPS